MDYDSYINVPNKRARGIARFIPAFVVFSAFTAFIALAWVAYHNGSRSLKEDDLVVIEAEKTPIKDKPLDPGGMKFPNQDKTIFENFSGNNVPPPKVERLMPMPEEPMPKSADSSQTTGWVNDKIIAPAPAEPAKEKIPEKEPEKIPDLSYKPAPEPIEKSNIHSVTPEGEIKSFAAPSKPPQINEKIAPKGTAKIQLGAYRSEKEAQDGFAKIQKKFSELEGKKPNIVKADLGEKGVFYRLRVGGIGAASDAKSLCQKLSSKGQPCLVAAE